jgi:hypothetical protein
MLENPVRDGLLMLIEASGRHFDLGKRRLAVACSIGGDENERTAVENMFNVAADSIQVRKLVDAYQGPRKFAEGSRLLLAAACQIGLKREAAHQCADKQSCNQHDGESE